MTDKALIVMGVDALAPDRFRAHEQAIREALSDLSVEVEQWNFREEEYQLDIALAYPITTDIASASKSISRGINDCFWSFPVFRHRRDARGIEDPLLRRMEWREHTKVLCGSKIITFSDGEYHYVDFEIYIEQLDDGIEDTLVDIRRFFVAWPDHDRQIKKFLASTTSLTGLSLPEGMPPSHVTFFLDSTVAVRYPGGEMCEGKDVLTKLSLEGTVLGAELAEPLEEEEASNEGSVQLFLNFPGVSQTRFEAVEEDVLSRMEAELETDSVRMFWSSGKTGLGVWVSCDDEDTNSIEERVSTIVESFNLYEDNDPNLIEDEESGTWYWDDRLKQWEADLLVVDEEQQPFLEVELSISATSREDDISSQLDKTKQFVADLNTHYHQIHEAISNELLETYNSNWNDDEPKDREEFLAEISFASINWESDGAITCYLESASLFDGHVIEVRLDPRGDVLSVSLAG